MTPGHPSRPGASQYPHPPPHPDPRRLRREKEKERTRNRRSVGTETPCPARTRVQRRAPWESGNLPRGSPRLPRLLRRRPGSAPPPLGAAGPAPRRRKHPQPGTRPRPGRTAPGPRACPRPARSPCAPSEGSWAGPLLPPPHPCPPRRSGHPVPTSLFHAPLRKGGLEAPDFPWESPLRW